MHAAACGEEAAVFSTFDTGFKVRQVGAEGVESAQLKSVKITNIADKRILIGISFGKIETIKINNNQNVALKLRQKAI